MSYAPRPMFNSRILICFAILVSAVSARAVDVAANLEVTAMSGRTVVFKGYTDERGRFETTPLPPGTYLFQLRIPKTMITPARYSLALAGARPMGDALVAPGVAVAMNAEVRRLTTVKGQASGRRVILVPATTPATSASTALASPTAVPMRSSTASVAPAISPAPNATRSPAAAAARTSSATGVAASSRNTATTMVRPMVTPSPTVTGVMRATPVAAATPSSRTATTVSAARPAATTTTAATSPARPVPTSAATTIPPGATTRSSFSAPTSLPAAATVSAAPAARPVAYPPRIINGQLYIWVPSAPGSNVGHWVLEAAASRATRAPSPAPSPMPARR